MLAPATGYTLAGCHSDKQVLSPTQQLREAGPVSNDPDVVGKWLLTELISQGADPERAQQARKRLSQLMGDDSGNKSTKSAKSNSSAPSAPNPSGAPAHTEASAPSSVSDPSDSPDKGLYAYLAWGIDLENQGHPLRAAKAYLQVIQVARQATDPIAPLASWYATNRILLLPSVASALWPEAKSFVRQAIDDPRGLNWRARGELVEWWAKQTYRGQTKTVFDQAADLHGCARSVKLVGPFGSGLSTDALRTYEPEKPGRWPSRFAPELTRPNVVAKAIPTQRRGCEIRAKARAESGVYYAETFFELKQPQDVLLTVVGAQTVFVDDVKLLDRDPRKWGIWPSFGVAVRLAPGRHRLVAKLPSAVTSVRIQRLNGLPLETETSIDDAPPYSLQRPQPLANPNLLARYVRNEQVVRPKSDLEAFLAAYLMHGETQADVGSVLMEPLVRNIEKAGTLALSQQAMLTVSDPAFSEGTARDLARELHQEVVNKDPGNWKSRFWLIIEGATKKGYAQAASDLRDLYDQYPEVWAIGQHLIQMYSTLQWQVQAEAVLAEMIKRFPDDEELLAAWIGVLESTGRRAQADTAAAKLVTLDASSEIQVDRALRRQDYHAAIQELERIGKVSPDRKEITDRIATVMRAAGMTKESFSQLEQAVKDKPQMGAPRLALADARLAAGQHSALRFAIAEAIEAGADTRDLDSAIDLVEGRTQLDPHRLDGLAVVRQFETSGAKMDGAAVRVLDYGVVWVHPDGSARMLEHEIVRVQSQDAISSMAEQQVPPGMLLRARVIKKDGRVFEPEMVLDKPTLTMPHMELGDYFETEWIRTMPGDDRGGVNYASPHWFFREQDIGYWRSEFVVIVPKNRELIIETNGAVPPPDRQQTPATTVYRWRVDKSPAALVELGSVPPQELLPNVRVGWGMTLQQHLDTLVNAFEDTSIADPRMVGIAQRIVKGVPKHDTQERARRVYRWVLANIEPGQERDARRIITGRSGGLGYCFLYLMRLLEIPTDIVVVRSSVAPPPKSKLSEAEQYSQPVFRVQTQKGDEWLIMQDRFTPFGYVPSQLRGQPGFVLVKGTPKVVIPVSGTTDGAAYEGEAVLRTSGSASIDVMRKFAGKYAISVRKAIEQVPEAQLPSLVEKDILASDLPGSSLVRLQLVDRDDLDKPFAMHINAESPDFARRSPKTLTITPPFSAGLGSFVYLPSRQTTLLMPDATRIEVKLRIQLPQGAKVVSRLEPTKFQEADKRIEINDRVEGTVLVLDRLIDLPAMRVTPQQYHKFQAFMRAADDAMQRDIKVVLP